MRAANALVAALNSTIAKVRTSHGLSVTPDRALWRTASVTPDEVFSTVLPTFSLRPTGGTWRETALRERADHHMETHATLRELSTLRLEMPPGILVHVCENPQVVEAAADTGRTAPLVCTSGSATTVVLALLDALAASGCAFAHHGDFDWPGIALANRIMHRYGAEPWRMRAADYEYLVARRGRVGRGTGPHHEHPGHGHRIARGGGARSASGGPRVKAPAGVRTGW
ncbi:DUF2399 domain-containing protein [Streptomyces sp. NPDC005907]|uniref:DUF2399 domain-containing protein n=1 Tax=Streptomyces sp. NPDC005907 TaxID=3154571 RepID=UPI0033FC4FF4